MNSQAESAWCCRNAFSREYYQALRMGSPVSHWPGWKDGGDTKNSVNQTHYVMCRAQCRMEMPTKCGALLRSGAYVTALVTHSH